MSRIATIILVGIAVLLVSGALAPATAPVTLTSPSSGSMEPTAPTHSLVVIIDISPQPGDIALYETSAQEQVVLHRLIEYTSGGEAFITQGDANLFTDQENGDPAADRSDIHGVVPEIAGVPFIIPYAGAVVTNPVFAIGAWTLLFISLLYTTTPGKVTRETVSMYPTDTYFTIIGIVILLVLPLVILTMPFTLTVELLTSVTADAGDSQIAAPGTTTTHDTTITSPLLAVLHTTAHATGDIVVTGVDSSLRATETTLTVMNTPSEQPVSHTGDITVYTYPPVLPQSVLTQLAAIHPAVAAYMTAITISLPMFITAFLIDSQKLVRASERTIKQVRRHRGE